MLREVDPNASTLPPMPHKPLLDSIAPPPTSVAAASPTNHPPMAVGAVVAVPPIPPGTALAELEAIRQRLLALAQGISAWNARPRSTSVDESYSADPVGREALAKLHENEVLLGQCTALQALQQQLSHERAPPVFPQQQQQPQTLPFFFMPPLVHAGAEVSQNLPSIFAPPQLQQQQHQQQSLRSTPPSSGSRRGNSPTILGKDADVVCGGDPGKLVERPSSYHVAVAAEMRETSQGSHRGTNSGSVVRRVPWPPLRDSIVAIVEFKRQRRKRCLCEAAIEPGTYVIIPGDRGYDCGLVVQCGRYDIATSELVEGTVRTMDCDVIDPDQLKGDMIPVTREATADEIQQLYSTQAARERLALKRCRELVQRLQLDMNVVDCEYQFDGTKVSFYFEAEHAIDFRALNKELYRIFNTRIWLENVNNSVKNTVPEGAMSKTDKAQSRRSGHRVPNSH